jgi:hypothetical protein
MFYYIEENLLIRKLPKSFFKQDGTLMNNFDQNSVDVLSDYGFYTVRNDNNQMPEDCEREDVENRSIILEKPYVDIVRKWIKKPTTNESAL